MTEKEICIYSDAIDYLVACIRHHSEYVCQNQSAFANELNKAGVQIFFKKDYPVAKACFWVARMLGNKHANRNWLCI